MTKRFYIKKNDISKKFYTAHVVISLAEKIEKAIDNKLFVCGVFVDVQKTFDTVNHNILVYHWSTFLIME